MTKLHRWAIVLLKYSPLIAGVMMLLHVALLLCGVHLHIAENIVGLPILPTIVCCVWSKAFGFCSMHRAFTIYTCIMTYCINYQSDTILGFGEGLLIARCMMLMGMKK